MGFRVIHDYGVIDRVTVGHVCRRLVSGSIKTGNLP